MRLFIGIDFEPELKHSIYMYQQKLKIYVKSGRLKFDDDFHLTLKFLGETAEDRLESLNLALEQITDCIQPFSLSLKGLDAFGLNAVSLETGLQAVRVLWLGVEGDMESLDTLYAAVEKTLVNAGFPEDYRPYAPHITMGQNLKLNGDFETVREIMGKLEGEINAFEITVFNSEIKEGRRCYTPLRRFKIGKIDA